MVQAFWCASHLLPGLMGSKAEPRRCTDFMPAGGASQSWAAGAARALWIALHATHGREAGWSTHRPLTPGAHVQGAAHTVGPCAPLL
jgi:hypothetical protein